MAYFSVNTDKIQTIADLLEQQANSIDRLSQSVNEVKNDLSIDGEMGARVKRKIEKSKTNTEVRSGDLQKMSRALRKIAETYRSTENRILGINIDKNYVSGNGAAAGNSTENSSRGANQNGRNTGSGKYSADPVNLSTGNFILDNKDMEISGAEPLVLSRFYNSRGQFNGVLGNDWNTGFETRLILNPYHRISGQDVCVFLEDGKEERFLSKNGKEFIPYFGTSAELEKTSEGYVYRSLDGDRYLYDLNGRYIRHENPHNIGFSLFYSGEQLNRVEKDSGEYYLFSYDEQGRLINAVDHTGRSCKYGYKDNHLSSVLLPDGSEYSYSYSADGKLKGVKNPVNTGVIEVEYDHLFRVTYQKFSDGTTNIFDYHDADNSVIMTERNGTQSVHYHDEWFQNIRNVYSDGEETFEYNNRGQKTKIKDKAGNIFCIKYDDRGNVTGVIKSDGTKWFATYNPQNRLITLSLNGEKRIHNVYNDYGDLLYQEDGIGRKTEYTYDEKGEIICVTLPDESRIEASYDERGNLTQIKTASGAVHSLDYDELNRPIRYTDACGMQMSYKYDQRDRVTEEIRPDGSSRQYTYDYAGNVIMFRDYDGAVVRAEYNANNKPIAYIDAMGRRTEYEYDSMWNISKVILPGGAVFSYMYNKENRLECVKDAEGNETRYTFDSLGNILTETDPSGNVTKYEWDSNGRCIKMTAPGGAETIFGYDAEDHEIFRKDAAGIELFRKFDAAGQLISEQDSLGQKKSYSYDALGRKICETDEKGHETKYHYLPGEEWKDEIIFADGSREKYAYNANGAVNVYTDPFGRKLFYEYDEFNRLSGLSDEQGRIKGYTYDAADRIITETDCDGNSREFAYSASGRLLNVTSSNGKVTRYNYDQGDELIEVIRDQEDGRPPFRICYERNAMGRITKLIDAMGCSETYKYSGTGRMISKVDRDGNETRYSYYPSGMLESVIWADGRKAVYRYNCLNRLTEIQDWTGTTGIEYDSTGNVTRIVYPDGEESLFIYDKHGNRTRIKYPGGDQVSYRYDSLDRLTDIFYGDRHTSFERNKSGQVTRKRYSDNNTIEYDYDQFGALCRMRHFNENGISNELSFGHDRFGRIESQLLKRENFAGDNGQYRYVYDAEGQLSKVFLENQLVRRYSYDELNRRRCLQKYDPETEQFENTYYEYNVSGALTAITRPGFREEYLYDRRGNMTAILQNGARKKGYTYDSLNRLTKAQDRDGREAEYVYNGLGYRVGMCCKDKEGEEKTTYRLDYSKIYDNLLERQTEGLQKEAYIWGSGLEGYLSLEGNTGWYLTDPLGSVLQRIDSLGSGYASNYDEFGNRTSIRGSDIFGYNGFVEDPIAGTYYAQARQYRSCAGTFDAMDRFGGDITMPSTLNPYIYCVNAPFTHTDKSAYWFGLDDLIAAGVGLIGGTAGQLIGDVAEGVTTGHWEFRWQDYTGAAIGGAAGGVTTLYAGPIAGGAVAGGTTYLIQEGLDVVTDPQRSQKSGWQRVGEFALSTGFGALSGGISKIAQKFAGTGPIRKLTSWLQNKGKLGGFIAKHLQDIAAGRVGNIWNQVTNLLHYQHTTIGSSAALKKKLFEILSRKFAIYFGKELLDQIKPSKFIWEMIKGKLKDIFLNKDNTVVCPSVV